ncbi:MAG: acyl carrier protein [Lachnospiraceae bacterium]|nr:acyl carrier protein [Lachnospiraceae bacterium]
MEEKIRRILFNISEEIKTTDTSENLLETGIIDSADIFTLVTALEKEFGIFIDGEDVIEKNFLSINNIIAFVKSKL